MTEENVTPSGTNDGDAVDAFGCPTTNEPGGELGSASPFASTEPANEPPEHGSDPSEIEVGPEQGCQEQPSWDPGAAYPQDYAPVYTQEGYAEPHPVYAQGYQEPVYDPSIYAPPVAQPEQLYEQPQYAAPEYQGVYEPGYDQAKAIDAAISEAVADGFAQAGLLPPQEAPADPRLETIAAEAEPPERQAELDALEERHPAIGSQAAAEAMRPTMEALIAEHGWEAGTDPEIVALVYESLGGDARFEDAFGTEQIKGGLLNYRSGQDAFT